MPLAGDSLVTVDRFVPHVSTVPANFGQTVGLFLREKGLASAQQVPSVKPHVVLFVHGGYSPSVVAYDLDYKDYSFMAALARAGFDVFAMTHTGYGASPKPMMDDPCNVDASHFMQYERGRHVLHRATREWLQSGAIEGMTHAELFADFDGRLQPLQRETGMAAPSGTIGAA